MVSLQKYGCQNICNFSNQWTRPVSMRKKLPEFWYDRSLLKKWGHGMAELVVYANHSKMKNDDHRKLDSEAVFLIDKFWAFQQENHEIIIPLISKDSSNVPEVYHYTWFRVEL